MKALFLSVFGFLLTHQAVSSTPSPKEIRNLDLRESLVLDIAHDWNVSHTMGDFLQKNVDPKVPRKKREEFFRFTKDFRWATLPQALPIKDTLLFLDPGQHAVTTIKILSIRPLIMETNGVRQSFQSTAQLLKYFKGMREQLPSVLRTKDKSYTGLLETIPDALFPMAYAWDLPSMALGAGILGAGVAAYSAYRGVREVGTRSYSNTEVNNYVTLEMPDTMNVNMHNITEEEHQKEQNALRQKRIEFRSTLGKWLKADTENGSCEAKGAFGPKTTMKPHDGLSETTFQQIVNGPVHEMLITPKGSSRSFLIEKTFSKDSDISPDHRVFKDEVTKTRICENSKCKETSLEDFQKELMAAVTPEAASAAEKGTAEFKGKVDAAVGDLKKKLGSALDANALDAEVMQSLSAENEKTNEAMRAKDQEIIDNKNKLGQIWEQVHKIVEDRSGAGVWNSLMGKTAWSHWDINEITDEILGTESMRDNPSAAEGNLQTQIKKSGAFDGYQNLLKQNQNLDKELDDLRSAYNAKLDAARKAKGLNENGSAPAEKDAEQIIQNSELCMHILRPYECGDVFFNVDRSQWNDEIDNLGKGAVDQYSRDQAEGLKNSASLFTSDLEANYSLAMCCDETECHNEITGSFAINSEPTETPMPGTEDNPSAAPAK